MIFFIFYEEWLLLVSSIGSMLSTTGFDPFALLSIRTDRTRIMLKSFKNTNSCHEYPVSHISEISIAKFNVVTFTSYKQNCAT